MQPLLFIYASLVRTIGENVNSWMVGWKKLIKLHNYLRQGPVHIASGYMLLEIQVAATFGFQFQHLLKTWAYKATLSAFLSMEAQHCMASKISVCMRVSEGFLLNDFLRAQRSNTAVIPILSKIVESSLRLVIFFIDEKRVIIFNLKKNHFELS